MKDKGIGIANSKGRNTKGRIKDKSIGLYSIKERVNMINLQEYSNKARFTSTSGVDQLGTIAIVCLPFFGCKPYTQQ